MIKNIRQYFKRIGCAILNKNCCATCDCSVGSSDDVEYLSGKKD